MPHSVQTRHWDAKNSTGDQLHREPAPCTTIWELQHPLPGTETTAPLECRSPAKPRAGGEG